MFSRAVKTFLAIAALVLVTGAAVVGYRLYQSPELRRTVVATNEMIELRLAGANDPGAVALREAGCEHAHAVNGREFARLLQDIDPGLGDDEPAAGAPATIVDCTLPGEEGVCRDLARAYVGGLERPPLTFAFTVDTASGERICSGVFGQNGRRVRQLLEGETNRAPDAVTRASRRPTDEATDDDSAAED